MRSALLTTALKRLCARCASLMSSSRCLSITDGGLCVLCAGKPTAEQLLDIAGDYLSELLDKQHGHEIINRQIYRQVWALVVGGLHCQSGLTRWS